MATRRVSVEISNSAVRMAEVAVGGPRPELINLSQVALPPKAVVDGVIIDAPAVKTALERCVKEGGISEGGVHLGIAGLRAITRELDMPAVPEAEIDSAVRLQALDVIPFAIDQAVISARPLEEHVGPDGQPERRVLIAAAHRDLIDPLLKVVTAAGLTPLSIEPTSSAMIRALYDPSSRTDGPEAIISVGAGLTTVVVHEDGVPHFVRTIAEGGETVTAAIAGALDLPMNDAESTKRNLDHVGPHIRVAATAAREASLSLIGELRSSIDYYATLPERGPVRRVIITGGGARLLGFVEQLQQQLRLPVVPGSALARIDTTRLGLPPEEVGRVDPSVAVVVGLALPGARDVKELDLLPPEVLAARARKRVERRLIAVGGLALVVMAGLGVWQYWKVHQAENQVATLQAQIGSYKALIPKYSKTEKQHAEIANYASIMVPIVKGEVNWPATITDLGKATPSGGQLSSFSGSLATPITPTPGAPALTASQTQIASVALTVVSPPGYAYFNSWYLSIERSGKLTVNAFGSIASNGKGKTVSFSATVGVTGEVTTSRLANYEEPR